MRRQAGVIGITSLERGLSGLFAAAFFHCSICPSQRLCYPVGLPRDPLLLLPAPSLGLLGLIWEVVCDSGFPTFEGMLGGAFFPQNVGMKGTLVQHNRAHHH